MTFDSINMISASFKDSTVTFEPWLTVFIEQPTGAEFFGAYKLAFPSEDEDYETSLPNLCLRRSNWNRKADLKRYQAALNKKDYIEGDEQISSEISFFSIAYQQKTVELIQELVTFIYSGVTTRAIERREADWQGLTIRLTDSIMAFELAYDLVTIIEEKLEEWAQRWKSNFLELNFQSGFIPDGDCRISYRASLEQLLDKF